MRNRRDIGLDTVRAASFAVFLHGIADEDAPDHLDISFIDNAVAKVRGIGQVASGVHDERCQYATLLELFEAEPL